MTTYKTKMTCKEMTESYFNSLLKYAGKKRLNKLMSIYLSNEGISAETLVYLYESSTNDCWEMTTFHDRITNKGFQRYSQNAIELFCQLVIDVVEGAKEFNLIK